MILNKNSNNKTVHEIPKYNNLTETNVKDNFKSRIYEKQNNILLNSTKHNRIKSLHLKTNSNYYKNDEKYTNSISVQKKNVKSTNTTPISLRVKNINSNLNDHLTVDNNYIKFYSVNKKDSLRDNNLINKSSKQINNITDSYNIKTTENKLPLYQKAYKNKNILERNKKDSLSLNKINLLTYEKKTNLIKKDNINLLNNIINYRPLEDKNNNMKYEKPIKLNLQLLNSNINSNSSHNLSENNRNENKMPLINQQKKNIINQNNK